MDVKDMSSDNFLILFFSKAFPELKSQILCMFSLFSDLNIIGDLNKGNDYIDTHKVCSKIDWIS